MTLKFDATNTKPQRSRNTRVIQKVKIQHGWEGKGNHLIPSCSQPRPRSIPLTAQTSLHPAHSPDLAPSDFHLFLHLKKHLVGQKFHEDEEVKNEVTTWLCAQAEEFYDIGIQKVVPRLNKCLDKGGDYV
jgi:hypothetical protein